jgi:polyisoprenoid-binding protein YceI
MNCRGRLFSISRAAPLAAAQAFLALILLGAGARAQSPEIYDIDPVHSAVNFKVRHLFTFVSGRFTKFGGTLWYDAQKPENSRIEITIQAASVDTDNEQRDNHLRSADFLDVQNQPQITFKSTRIERAGDAQHYRVTGDFTLHGVTKPVTVTVEMLGFGESPGLGKRGGFAAQTTLDRRDFGIVWNKTLESGSLLLGTDVQVDFPIEVALHQEKPEKK